MQIPLRRVVDALAAAGCIAPLEEAQELMGAAAAGVGDLETLTARRQQGEPLAWIVRSARFCGIRVRVDPGVYVPRPHTEELARRAASLLPAGGVAIDLCTGSGAVAVVMRSIERRARVVATDDDPSAVACARRNGVEARQGDLDAPVPSSLVGMVDVMTAVVPYVPTEELHLLPRDVLAYEPRHALDGGDGGLVLLERVARLSVRWLRAGGRVLLELGGDQAEAMRIVMAGVGLTALRVHRDSDGRDRWIEGAVGGRTPRPVEG